MVTSGGVVDARLAGQFVERARYELENTKRPGDPRSTRAECVCGWETEEGPRADVLRSLKRHLLRRH